MKFKQSAHVVTLDNKEAGQVYRVVIDPKTDEITHLVVRRGHLMRQDKVVPISAITAEDESHLNMHVRSDDLDLLPNYEEEQYITADNFEAGDPPWAVILYPPYPGGIPGIAYYGLPYVMHTHLNIPDNTVALKEGAKVIARDQKEVGHVTEVLASSATDRATHFLIGKGLLVKEYRLIPVSWVDRLAADEVYLAIDSHIVERLPVIEAT